MASVTRDKRTNKVLIRAYAGVNPSTKKERTISTTMPADATEEEIEEAKAELDAKAAVLKKSSAVMTIGALVDYWIEGCELTEMSPSTISSYRSYIRCHVKKRIGHVLFDKADASTFSGLYKDLRKPKSEGGAGLAASTVEKMHAMLSGCFSTLKSEGTIPSNPMLGVKVARAKPVEVQPLLPEDYAKLVTYLQRVLTSPIKNDEDFEAYVVAVMIWADLHTGLRRGELAGAQERHYLAQVGVWGIRVARVLIQVKKKDGSSSVSDKEPKSNASKRFVSTDEETTRILDIFEKVKRAVLAEHGVRVTRATPLFCHADGSQFAPSQITDAFKGLVERLNLAKGVHLHTLRHTHASYLLDHGASLKDIQERLGHEKIETTGNLYAHLMPGRDQELAEEAAQITREMTSFTFEEEVPLFAPICPRTGETCVRFSGEALADS